MKKETKETTVRSIRFSEDEITWLKTEFRNIRAGVQYCIHYTQSARITHKAIEAELQEIFSPEEKEQLLSIIKSIPIKGDMRLIPAIVAAAITINTLRQKVEELTPAQMSTLYILADG